MALVPQLCQLQSQFYDLVNLPLPQHGTRGLCQSALTVKKSRARQHPLQSIQHPWVLGISSYQNLDPHPLRRLLAVSQCLIPSLRMKKLPPWLPCSRPRLRTGKKLKKRCPSWCCPLRVFIYVVVPSLMNNVFCPLVLHIHSSQRIYSQPRGTGFNRGGKPHQPHQPHQPHNDKPLPPSYVCYRCGQKGSPRHNADRSINTNICLRPLDPRLPDK